MEKLSLRDIRKSYGNVDVLKNINLEIEKGEFVVFVGPSGCGKSTLLRMIAGLEDISGGELEIGGVRMNDVPPAQRGIAMVFQTYALYPHMTVRENMAFSLKLAKMPKDEINKKVEAAASTLQLDSYLDRLPKALSGGQRQRVAIGRAIVRNPKVFLFDEPLSNLDAALRVATRIEIAKLSQSLPDTTMIYVTHDQVEAMTLADRIVVLNGKIIEQVGAPLVLYEKPHNIFVAQFIGSPKMNILKATIVKTGKTTQVDMYGQVVNLPIATPKTQEGKSCYVGARPEHMRIAKAKETVFLEGVVEIVESLGETTLIYLRKDKFKPVGDEPLVVKLSGSVSVASGDKCEFAVDAENLHFFDEDGINFRTLGRDSNQSTVTEDQLVMS